MVDIITANNRQNFERQMRSMFKDRRHIFVDRLKWNLAITPDGLEIDEFDNKDALYLLISKPNGDHMGSMRLLRTDRPHILGSLFPDLCAGQVPAAPYIFEITRLCLCPGLRASVRFQIRNRLISGMVDFALMCGVAAFTGVVSTRFLSEILEMGWICKPLGPNKIVNGSSIGAFSVEIDKTTPRRLRSTGIYIPRSLEVTYELKIPEII